MSQSTSIPVLMYHHVSPCGGAHSVPPALFREQLAWLRRNGTRILTGSEFAHIALGDWWPDEPSVLLTFDDGWLDNWVHALPVLKEFDAPAIFFVITSWPSGDCARMRLLEEGWRAPDHWDAMKLSSTAAERDRVIMRWSELVAARDTGLVELHSHSHTHGSWWGRAAKSREDSLCHLKEDLQASRAALISVGSGSSIQQFCWPRGEFTLAMKEVVRELGYEVQHSTMRGANSSALLDGAVVRRLNVEPRQLAWFQSRVALYSHSLPATLMGWPYQIMQGLRMNRRHSPIWRQHGGFGRKWWATI